MSSMVDCKVEETINRILTEQEERKILLKFGETASKPTLQMDGSNHRHRRSKESSNVDHSDLLANWGQYCRINEQEAVWEAYDRVRGYDTDADSDAGHPKTELVLISGETGTGKTTLAQTVREQTTVDNGHFVTGKFEQLQIPEPHAAFVEAFNGFVDCTIGRGEKDMKRTRRAISKAVGAEGTVLTDMVPDMKKILGPQEESLAKVNHSAEALNRFRFVVRAFLRSVAAPEYPFVMLLDDLQWADDSSLDLLTTLLRDNKIRGMLFIVTVRSDDEEGSRKVDQVLSKVKEADINLTGIELYHLDVKDLTFLLANIMNRGESEVARMASHVREFTGGNLFLVRECLVKLKAKKLLSFQGSKNCWTWDDEEIEVELGTKADLIGSKLRSISMKVREMLKIASCLGTKLDEDLLKHLMAEPVFSYLQEAADVGVIGMDHWKSRYEFLHDSVQEATYNLISEEERPIFHFDIGRRLWKSFDSEEIDKFIFVIVGQFMLGDGRGATLKDRKAVATLLLRAGERAVRMSSFQTASMYLLHAIDILGDNFWRDCYSLSLDLFNAAAEVAYCNGQFSSVEMLVNDVIQHARNVDDTYRAEATRVYALGSGGRAREAIASGLKVLKGLGITFPANPTMNDVSKELKRTRKRLKGKTNEALLRLPDMTDPPKLAAMQLLNLLFVYAYLSKIELSPLIGFTMVHLSLDSGSSAVSCVGFVVYAMCLCGLGDDINEGYRYGQLSIAMYEKFKEKAWLVRLSAGYYGCVHPWKKPVQEILVPLKHAHRVGLESGDIEFAMLNANIYCWAQFDLTSLPQMDVEMQGFSERMELYGQATTISILKPMWQTMHILMGHGTGKPYELNGHIMTEADFESLRKVSENNYVWSFYYRMLLCYLFGEYEKAEENSKGCRMLVDFPFGAPDIAQVLFFETMTLLMLARKSKQGRLALVKKRLDRLTVWAQHSPYNFLGRKFLIEAELAVVRGDHDHAFSKYVCAISLSKESGSFLCSALANERLGKHFFDQGQRKEAKFYIDEAVDQYEQWGALAKAKHLRNEIRFVGFA